jgi:hypothetical protein
MTPIEQLTLDFARLVGYPDAEYAKDITTPGRFWKNHKSHTFIPDYPNDRNATEKAIEALGLIWERKVHRSWNFTNGLPFKDTVVYYVSDAEWNVTKSERVNTGESPCIALMRAAVAVVKAEEK